MFTKNHIQALTQALPEINSKLAAIEAAQEWNAGVTRGKQILRELVGDNTITKTDLENMVSRFLGWKLPADFAPDAGITFEPLANPNSPVNIQFKHTPAGTNLFTADQARAMFLHALGNPTITKAEK